MRNKFGPVLLTGLVVLSGCLLGKPPEEVVTTKSLDTAKVAAPITPESFTDENYRAAAEALWAEMEREERELNVPSADASAKRR